MEAWRVLTGKAKQEEEGAERAWEELFGEEEEGR